MEARSKITNDIKNFVLEGIDLSEPKIVGKEDVFWQKLKQTGTELWLDTGDLDEAAKIWTTDMSALTTNNTLLNKEVQKGIYDHYIKEVNALLDGISLEERITEIAFVLNARHGLRLVETFGGKVSVELHTAISHDLDAIVAYGKRFHDICPNNFIVKVPLTATGLLGARKLREAGIPINFTLEFSARQNALVSYVAKPNYLNVFLGRLNAYVIDNGLGDGKLIGEKATLSAQRAVTEITKNNKVPTRLIAASLRSAEQLEALAGVNVFTMPTAVAQKGKETLSGDFQSKVSEDYSVKFNEGIDADQEGLNKLWNISEQESSFFAALDQDVPATGKELEERAIEAGLTDMFPVLSDAEHKKIASDGKIPVHKTWQEKIYKNEIAPDTLLNLAGLYSFTNDQNALDKRIEAIIA
ncbi:MAG TPA: transaldolase [Cytophagales bacterium]|jgi:transaldolase|nr:transaldolase [Cytophagales bacterium]